MKKPPVNKYEAAIRSHEWTFLRPGLTRCIMCKTTRRLYASGNSRYRAFREAKWRTAVEPCSNASVRRPGKPFPWKLTELAFCKELEEVLG